jgi:hypothetical protein
MNFLQCMLPIHGTGALLPRSLNSSSYDNVQTEQRSPWQDRGVFRGKIFANLPNPLSQWGDLRGNPLAGNGE